MPVKLKWPWRRVPPAEQGWWWNIAHHAPNVPPPMAMAYYVAPGAGGLWVASHPRTSSFWVIQDLPSLRDGWWAPAIAPGAPAEYIGATGRPKPLLGRILAVTREIREIDDAFDCILHKTAAWKLLLKRKTELQADLHKLNTEAAQL